MKEIANRVGKIDSSVIRRVFDLAQQVKNPIDLSIGQPDFDVPGDIKEIAINSIKSGFNHYTPTMGMDELRVAIATKVKERNSIDANLENVLVTTGTTGAIFLTYLALLNPGDEVIIFDPYFVVYKHLAILLGAKPVILDTRPDFQPRVKDIKAAITNKTKLIVLNSPNNPTGAVYDEKLIREIVKTAEENDLFILSDEVYEDFIYEGRHFSPGSIYKNVITLNGLSKSAAMTGWRIGYAVGPEKVINEMAKLQQYSFVCAPSFAQKAAIKALDINNDKIRDKYRKKRDIVFNGLKNHYQIVKPQGAFYMFVKAPGDENSFVERLLREKVIVVPGSAFSEKDGYFRISFANKNITLSRAVKAMVPLGRSKK